LDGFFGTIQIKENENRMKNMETAASELVKYKLDLTAVKEVTWVGDGSQPVHECTFFYGNGNDNYHLRSRFFVYKEVISAYKGISYVTLPGFWCNIIVLNVNVC
jgi:hypothetical protein